jgi:hypothetical protein
MSGARAEMSGAWAEMSGAWASRMCGDYRRCQVTQDPGRRNDLIVRSPTGSPHAVTEHPHTRSRRPQQDRDRAVVPTSLRMVPDEVQPMSLHDGILWTETANGRWEGSCGTLLVGVVSWSDNYSVHSTGGEVNGQHSTLDSAKAQLEGWMRWMDSTAD